MDAPRLLVYNATAFRLNERLTAQQGTFLVQGTLAKPFSENLRESLTKDAEEHFWPICLKIDGASRDEILCELNNMNINHATLYPDLEGFGKSLERHMAYPENWGLAIKKRY
jgi:ribulose bisphosphate carboxylase small subunit